MAPYLEIWCHIYNMAPYLMNMAPYLVIWCLIANMAPYWNQIWRHIQKMIQILHYGALFGIWRHIGSIWRHIDKYGAIL